MYMKTQQPATPPSTAMAVANQGVIIGVYSEPLYF